MALECDLLHFDANGSPVDCSPAAHKVEAPVNEPTATRTPLPGDPEVEVE